MKTKQEFIKQHPELAKEIFEDSRKFKKLNPYSTPMAEGVQFEHKQEHKSFEDYVKSIQPKVDWDILSFRDKENNENIWYKIADDVFRKEKGIVTFTVQEMNVKNTEIYQVKYKENIFTIGSRVTHVSYPKNNGIITKFEIEDNNVLAHYGGCYQTISVLKHSKIPIFTTHDNEEIYEEDSYYYIDNSNTISKVNECNKYGGKNTKVVYFKSKENAEDFLFKSSMQLCLNDVKETDNAAILTPKETETKESKNYLISLIREKDLSIRQILAIYELIRTI